MVGIVCMDYLMADPWTLPPSEDASFTEKIWRLPETYICFTAPEVDVPVAALIWLLPGIVMGSATRIVAYDFSARGRPELNSYLAIVVLVINVAANLVLIPRYGIIGGALSTTIAYTANTIATVYLYRKFSDLASWKLFILQRDDMVMLREAAKIALARARSRRPAR
jgi:O-antigen/teichoic acid export membrane protein